MKHFIVLIFVILLLLFSLPSLASGGDSGGSGTGNNAGGATLEVEIDAGPRFHEDDRYEIQYCTQDIFWNFFPMDFLYNGSFSSYSNECPSVEFFGYTHEMCFLLDAYRNIISPAFILSMMVYAIFHL